MSILKEVSAQCAQGAASDGYRRARLGFLLTMRSQVTLLKITLIDEANVANLVAAFPAKSQGR